MHARLTQTRAFRIARTRGSCCRSAPSARPPGGRRRSRIGRRWLAIGCPGGVARSEAASAARRARRLRPSSRKPPRPAPVDRRGPKRPCRFYACLHNAKDASRTACRAHRSSAPTSQARGRAAKSHTRNRPSAAGRARGKIQKRPRSRDCRNRACWIPKASGPRRPSGRTGRGRNRAS